MMLKTKMRLLLVLGCIALLTAGTGMASGRGDRSDVEIRIDATEMMREGREQQQQQNAPAPPPPDRLEPRVPDRPRPQRSGDDNR